MVISVSVTLSTCFDLDYVFADWCIGLEGHYWMSGSSAERRQHAPSILIYAAKCLQDGDYWSRRRQSFWKVGRPGFFPKSLKYVLRVTNRCSNHPSGVGMGSSPHEFWCNFFDEALSMLAIWTYPSVLSNSRKANDEAKKKKKAEQKKIKRTLWREAEGIHLVYHKLFQTSWV